jgi:hypothetical protein
MTSKVITSMSALLDAIRARRDELNLSHETIDSLAGFPAGYTGKLLAPVPVRGISHMSLTAILGALGIGLVVVEDTAQRAKVEDRWQPRKRAVTKRSDPGALLTTGSNPMLPSTNASGDKHVVQTTFEFSPEARTCRPDQGRGVGRPAAGEPVPFEPDRGCLGCASD